MVFINDYICGEYIMYQAKHNYGAIVVGGYVPRYKYTFST